MNNQSCAQVREDIGAYIVGALRGRDAEIVRRHLDSCVECELEYRRLAEVAPLLSLVDEATLRSMEVPAGEIELEAADGPPGRHAAAESALIDPALPSPSL